MLRVALVTGGIRGLGREISLALASEGYVVAANYLKSRKDAEELAESLGGNAVTLQADVGDREAVNRMVSEIRRNWGRLDVLVNNAGVTSDALLVKLAEEDWDRVIDANLTGCFNMIKTSAPLMKDGGGGHIINVSSISGVRGKEGQAAYSASKAALLGLTVSAARELAEHNIRVNAVLPGYMATGMGRDARKAMNAAEEKSLLGKLSDPKEVAEFVIWLAGTKTVTGQIFTLDSRL